jgi:hypothetical protein
VLNFRFDHRAGGQLTDCVAAVNLRAAQLDGVPANVRNCNERISVNCRQPEGHGLRGAHSCVHRAIVRGDMADSSERREGGGHRMNWKHAPGIGSHQVPGH